LPIPGQEFVEAAGGMSVGHALQDVSEPCEGLDVIELCGGDERADSRPSDAAAVQAREQMVFAPARDGPDGALVEEDTLATALVTVWMSGDPDFIPSGTRNFRTRKS
jgi:hypothetical protein